MNLFKKLFAVSTAGMLALSFAGCQPDVTGAGSSEVSSGLAAPSAVIGENVTIRFFNAIIENVDWYQQKIDAFQAEHSNIKVEMEFQKDFDSALKVKFQTEDIPEIVNGGYQQVYADQSRYLDLGDMERWWSRLTPGIKEICTDYKTGKAYFFTTSTSSFGLLYNKALYKELGLKDAVTYDEFLANLTAIKEAKPGVAPLHVGSKDAWMLGQMMDVWGYSPIREASGNVAAKKAMVENSQDILNFSAPDGAIALFGNAIIDLREGGLLNTDFLTATYDNSLEAFANGKTATLMQGLWTLPLIKEKNPDFTDIGFAALPALKEGDKPCVLNAPDIKYSICADSTQQETAKNFLDYLFQADNQKEYTEFRQCPTAFTDVNADWGPMKTDVEKALSSAFAVDWSDAPIGFAADDVGRMTQDLYAGKYADGKAFAEAYSSTWIKAWESTYK